MELKLLTVSAILAALSPISNAAPLFAPHRSSIHFNINNQTNSNYLFAGVKHTKANEKTLQAQNVISNFVTNDAFVDQLLMFDYSGSAPQGEVTYYNQNNGSTCIFHYGRNVVVTSGANHCLVTSVTKKSSLGVTYEWDANITIR